MLAASPCGLCQWKLERSVKKVKKRHHYLLRLCQKGTISKARGGHGVDPSLYIAIYISISTVAADHSMRHSCCFRPMLGLKKILLFPLSCFSSCLLSFNTGSKRKETTLWFSTTQQLGHLNAHLFHFGFLYSSESNGIAKWHCSMFWHLHIPPRFLFKWRVLPWLIQCEHAKCNAIQLSNPGVAKNNVWTN